MVGEYQPFYGRTGLLESRLLAPLPPPSAKWISARDRSGMSFPRHHERGEEVGQKKRGREEETATSSSLSAPLKWHPSSIFVVPQLLLHYLVHDGGALPSSFGVLLLLQHVSQRLLHKWWRLAFPSSSLSLGENDGRHARAGKQYERHQAALLQFLLSWHYSCLYCQAHHDVPEGEVAKRASLDASSVLFSSVQTALSEAGALWKTKEAAALSCISPSLGSKKETKDERADGAPTNHSVVGGRTTTAEWCKWFIPSLTLVGVKERSTEKDPESGRSEVFPAVSWRSVTLIGRDPAMNDIVLRHPSCSGQHAALQVALRSTGWEEEEEEEEVVVAQERVEEQKGSPKRVGETEERGGHDGRLLPHSSISVGDAHGRMAHLLQQGSLVEAITTARQVLVSCRMATSVGNHTYHEEVDGTGWSGHPPPRTPADSAAPPKPNATKTSEREEKEDVLSFLLAVHAVVSDTFAATLEDIHLLGGGIQAAFSLELEVVDLGSTNGTYLCSQGTSSASGAAVSLQRIPPFVPHVLKEGDSIRFGLSSRAFVLIRPDS